MTYQEAEQAAKTALTETAENQLITEATGGYELNGDGRPVAVVEERWTEGGGIVPLVFPL